MLINVNVEDPRVPLWGNLKYIEKLRDLALSPKRCPDFSEKNIVLRINKDGGHFGSSNNEKNLTMAIWEFAWLDFLIFKRNTLLN